MKINYKLSKDVFLSRVAQEWIHVGGKSSRLVDDDKSK